MFETITRVNRSKTSKCLLILGPILVAVSLLLYQISVVKSDSSLSIEILAGYNLVVDSNVTSSSTASPSVATIGARFCNPGPDSLKDVVGYIGDQTANTPGVYPARASGVGSFDAEHPQLVGSGSYSFAHLGGVTDAIRYIGDLAPGQCSVQYWSFSYPRCEGNQQPPCSQDPVFGASSIYTDDLYLTFDVWGQGTDAADTTTKTASATHKMTMRSEISAMANKIEPNPDGDWFNTETSTVYPGDVITSNGVNYTFGNVGGGYDNNGDGVFDNNAWMQPFGDPSYDPTCFRLVRTTGTLTVTRSGGLPPLIIPFTDRLYFNLPPNNTNVTGLVRYTFLALNGACTAGMTPYQEAASGTNNEKFNADYGTAIPPLVSYEPEVSLDKTGPVTGAENTNLTYTIPFSNVGATSVGLTLSSGIPVNMPFTVQDSVPDGLSYVCQSASLAYTGGYTMLYSKDSGLTWSGNETVLWPECAALGTATIQASTGPNSRILVQWRLNDPLPAGASGTATFQARIPSGYLNGGGAPVVENTACAKLDNAPSNLACDTTVTLVQGNNSIGDLVWRDDGGTTGIAGNGMRDGDEAGIPDITVWLYWDRDGDGVLDEGDPLLQTTTSGAGGSYSFSGLPDGKYIVKVDAADSNLPEGYAGSTPTTVSVDLDSSHTNSGPVTNNDIDFGFRPVLEVDKRLTSPTPAYIGEDVTFSIDLYNRAPGDGTPQGFCTYTTYASIAHDGDTMIPPSGNNANSRWVNYPAARFAPDNQLAQSGMRNTADLLGLSGFTLGPRSAAITKVEYIVYARELVDFLPADLFAVRVYYGDTQISADAQNSYQGAYFNSTTNPNYIIRKDITALRTWTWADFSGDANDAEIQLYAQGGSASSGDIGVDAVGFIITTNQSCVDASNTIQVLPLADTYDADLLQFVSANPPVSSAAVTGAPPNQVGTLTWTDLGPLYGGGVRTVNVTFRTLAATPSTTNTASVAEAVFANGRPVNDDSDDAVVEISGASGSINGRVWVDVDNGGWIPTTGWNAGDTFIPNVTMELWGCMNPVTRQILTTAQNTQSCTAAGGVFELLRTTTTNGASDYSFTGLRPGWYNVKVRTSTIPSGFVSRAETNPLANGGYSCPPLTSCDSLWNTDGANFNTFNTLTAGENIYNVSFGYRHPSGYSGITGYLWHDSDYDGVWDVTEAPLPGVRVYLCAAGVSPCNSGNALAADTTDAYGFYDFSRLAGSYQVWVETGDLPGMTQSGDPDQPGVPCTTCDNQTTTPIALPSQTVLGPYNFGYTNYLNIGDLVWTDWNGNGAPDAGEAGIPGITVRLYRDANGNGLIDLGTDTLLASNVTDLSGLYSFTRLAGAGAHYIVLLDETGIPGGYTQTGDPDEDPGACTTCDAMGSVTLTSANDLTIDFGYQPPVSAMGGTIWQDNDGDGTLDFGEPGIPGVVVTLYRTTDGGLTWNPVTTRTTDADGFYLFSDLIPGDYRVIVTDAGNVLNDFTLTYDPDAYSTNPAKPFPPCDPTDPDYQDCDETSTTGLLPGTTDLSHDFGYKPLGVLGDTLWVDLNQNDLRDSFELGVDNVTVRLYLDNGDGSYGASDTLVRTTTTDLDGLYSFGNLPPGTYFVVVDPADPDLAGLTQTFEMNAATPDGVTKVRLTAGAVDQINDVPCTDCAMQVDFGYIYNGNNTLNGTVFFDVNQNSLYEPAGTPPETTTFANITINLWSCGPDGLCNTPTDNYYLGSTLTDANGVYTFGNLPDGVYSVSIDHTAPSISLLTLTSASPQTVSLDPAHSTTAPVSSTHDFGLYAYMDCGDLPNAYNYRTTLDQEGPCHISPATPNPTLYLGATWDNDYNGQGVSGLATGDDTTGNDDEDGVDPIDFANWHLGGTRQISVYVTGANAYLAGWFDWNDDGDFVDGSGGYDPGEYINFGPVAPGLNTLNLTVPACTTTCFSDDSYDTLYARFRLYDSTNLPASITHTGLVANGEVEDYRFANAPTAVDVADFSASYRPLRIVIHWETALELDTLGFNLLRSTSLDGERVQINAQLIPSQAPGGFGGSYEFVDYDIQSGVTYYYWLAFVETAGDPTPPYGPVQARAERSIFIPLIRK